MNIKFKSTAERIRQSKRILALLIIGTAGVIVAAVCFAIEPLNLTAYNDGLPMDAFGIFSVLLMLVSAFLVLLGLLWANNR